MENRISMHPHKPHATSHGCSHRGSYKRTDSPQTHLTTSIANMLGRIPKGAFVRWAMQLLPVTVQRGNAELYRWIGLVIPREQGLRYDAAFAVPVLMS